MRPVTETPLISLDHEELVIRRGRRSGVYTIVAVHSTALGPALGGCRMWRYESSAEGARDALRLSRAMTFKTAACGLDVGGGKGVICLQPGRAPTGRARRDLLLDFADTVNVLEGSYITAEDVGTGPKDMAAIASGTKYVTGLDKNNGGSGDPSPFTALGVEAAMRACCEKVFGSPDLKGRTVAVVGAGRVGSQLAKRLAKAGAKLLVADIDESRRAAIDKLPGATWTDPSSAMLAEVDVLAPCALGGVIDQVNVGLLQCRIVCGSANNILAHEVRQVGRYAGVFASLRHLRHVIRLRSGDDGARADRRPRAGSRPPPPTPAGAFASSARSRRRRGAPSWRRTPAARATR